MEKTTLEKINRFTRRELGEDEVYTFSVILCDNDIDRDLERFSDEALVTLAEKFIGRTGISDHDPSSANQTARIFDTQIMTDESRTTAYGAPYRYLKAEAYMVRTSSNAELIKEIDGGIKKEVSISCSAAKRTCSVCGAENGSCAHVKGKSYGGKVCHTILGVYPARKSHFHGAARFVGDNALALHGRLLGKSPCRGCLEVLAVQ